MSRRANELSLTLPFENIDGNDGRDFIPDNCVRVYRDLVGGRQVARVSLCQDFCRRVFDLKMTHWNAKSCPFGIFINIGKSKGISLETREKRSSVTMTSIRLVEAIEGAIGEKITGKKDVPVRMAEWDGDLSIFIERRWS